MAITILVEETGAVNVSGGYVGDLLNQQEYPGQ